MIFIVSFLNLNSTAVPKEDIPGGIKLLDFIRKGLNMPDLPHGVVEQVSSNGAFHLQIEVSEAEARTIPCFQNSAFALVHCEDGWLSNFMYLQPFIINHTDGDPKSASAYWICKAGEVLKAWGNAGYPLEWVSGDKPVLNQNLNEGVISNE